MATTAINTFTGDQLTPAMKPESAVEIAVRLAPSVTYAKGQVLGELVGTDEVQTITLTTGGTLGGTYTLTFGGLTTANIAFNATAAAVQAALEALATIGTGNVLVTGTTPTTSGGVLTATFRNDLGNRDVAALTGSASGLTGASPGLAIATATPGAGTASEVQSVFLTGTPAGGTFTLTFGGQTTAAIPYNATAAAVQSALAALTSVGAGNVTVAGAAGGPWLVTFTGALAGTDVAAMTTSGAGLTGGSSPASNVATPVAGQPGNQGTFAKYLAGNTDGSQRPSAILKRACATDAAGNVTFGAAAGGNEWGISYLSAPVFIRGLFFTQDLAGLDEGAVAQPGLALKQGTVRSGIVSLA